MLERLSASYRLGQPLGRLPGLLAAGRPAEQLEGQVAAHLLERAVLGRLALLHADHVEAVLAAHRVAQRAGLQGEGGLVEGRHHLAAPEEAEVAAVRLGARVLARLLGDHGELLSSPQPLEHRAGALLHRGDLLVRRIRLHAQQDVPRPGLLGHVVEVRALLVELARVLLSLGEEGLDRLLVPGEVLRDSVRVEHREGDAHRLEPSLHRLPGFALGDVGLGADHAQELPGQGSAALLLAEGPLAAELVGHPAVEGLLVEASVRAPEAGGGEDLTLHLLLGHGEPELLGLQGQDGSLHEQAGCAHVQRVAQRPGVELVAEYLSILLFLLGPRPLELADADLVAANLHHGVRAAPAPRAARPHVDGEHGPDAHDDQRRQPALALSDRVEHGLLRRSRE